MSRRASLWVGLGFIAAGLVFVAISAVPGTPAYTFSGPGRYPFASHATGHCEAEMAGMNAVVP